MPLRYVTLRSQPLPVAESAAPLAIIDMPITHKTPRTRKYFHETQIPIMAAALAGAIDIDEADLKWRVVLARMREEVMAL